MASDPQEPAQEIAEPAATSLNTAEYSMAAAQQDLPQEWDTAEMALETLRLHAIPSSPSCLVFIYPSGPLMGKRVALEQPEYIIGRGQEADIRIERSSVSRRHARLFRRKEAWAIEDLGSTNGVVINGNITDVKDLQDGETLRIGDTVMRFLSGDNVEAAYHEELYRLTILDGLTGVVNKRFFMEALRREAAQASRYGHPLSLLMMDIDHFKQINDTYGHQVGDVVIQVVASRIRPRIRRDDLFARFGGDEFAVILTHTDREGAVRVAESIRKLVANRPILVDGQRLALSVSLGIGTHHSTEPLDPAALMQEADKALYEAKQAGRNRVATLVPEA